MSVTVHVCIRGVLFTECCVSPGSTVTASPTTVLDVSPYNNFTLTCTGTVTPSVTPTISYVWSGNHVTTMDSSTITVLSTTTGTSPYQCSATVTVSGLTPVTAVNSTIVTVGGNVIVWRCFVHHA